MLVPEISLTIHILFLFFSISCRSLYELNFLQAKPAKGFYKLTINIAPKQANSKLLGTAGAEVSGREVQGSGSFTYITFKFGMIFHSLEFLWDSYICNRVCK